MLSQQRTPPTSCASIRSAASRQPIAASRSLCAYGRQLFRQRVIYHLTRLAPSLEELDEATAAVDEETSLLGFWCEQALLSHTDSPDAIADAERAFHQFMSQGARRDRLAVIRERHVVTTEVHKEMRSRYPIAPGS